MNTVGYMKELKRIQVGNFKIENSVAVEELTANFDNEKYIENKIISIEKLFENNEKIILNSRKLELFLNGVKITQNYADGVYKIYDENSVFIGLGVVENKLLKRDIIL